MLEYSPEPWEIQSWIKEIQDSAGNTVLRASNVLTMTDAHRIVACVNFCRHLPTGTIEKLLALHVGAASALQWLRLQEHGCRVTKGNDLIDVCWQCGHIQPQHDDNCLLGKAIACIP